MELDLAGKAALVTGGGRGIGRSIVLRLAREGCRIACCGRTVADLEATASEVRALGGEACPIVADLAREGEGRRFVREAEAALGAVDLIVVNAGASFGGGLAETDRSVWEQTIALNLLQTMEVIAEAAPKMASRGGGSVVLVTSISGRKPVHRRAQYGAAKAAMIHMAQSLAIELAPARIRVNSVSPGSILVPGGGWERLRKEQPERFETFVRQEFPWGRLGHPDEVADVVAFVLSSRAMWINGADIPVDGAQGRPAAY
ncbi:MAG TPA: SDR family oxidoreductase [Blastocatellia bacterium]|nr:SDR family oxidoreductase [Blastocatellia bacterium]